MNALLQVVVFIIQKGTTSVGRVNVKPTVVPLGDSANLLDVVEGNGASRAHNTHDHEWYQAVLLVLVYCLWNNSQEKLQETTGSPK